MDSDRPFRSHLRAGFYHYIHHGPIKDTELVIEALGPRSRVVALPNVHFAASMAAERTDSTIHAVDAQAFALEMGHLKCRSLSSLDSQLHRL